MTEPVLARATVRVPATTANLGAGFDCVGLAVDQWLRVTAEVRAASADRDATVTIERAGTLRELDATTGADATSDLIWRGFRAASASVHGVGRAHGRPVHVHFDATSQIPIARGLGSSAAALLAGAALANATLGLRLSTEDLARLGTELEGHGDNVGAAAFGGAVLVAPRANGPCFAPLVVHESLGFAFAVPEFETRTELARAALPTQVPFDTAVSAATRAASLVRGLQTADRDLLAAALDDVLHVPSRKSLIPHFERVAQAARTAGAYGATLSGSGSSLVAIAPRELAPHIASAMADAWGKAGIAARPVATGILHTGLTLERAPHASTAPSPNRAAASARPPRTFTCP